MSLPQATPSPTAIEDIPGAEAIKLTPSMRGDKRVAVRFNLAARKASDEAPHEDYVQKFESSDNLKWALSGDTVAENQAPLGKPLPQPAAGASRRTVGASTSLRRSARGGRRGVGASASSTCSRIRSSRPSIAR